MTLSITQLQRHPNLSEIAPPVSDPFALKDEEAQKRESSVHIIRKGVRCDTESRGFVLPHGGSPLEIVLDASEGFIPLWSKGITLRWRFRESSLQRFQYPELVKAEIEQMLGEAILAWGDAAPVKFAQRDDAWDFEIVVKQASDCDINGCVLASAFFPDAGQHELTIYPEIFTQTRQEKIETLAHEIGHIFGLRHFFAMISESAWPSVVFGKHSKFSIMNYGADSKLTDNDRKDLRKLYERAWANELTQINGTPIKFVQPFHNSGIPASIALAAAKT